MNDMHFEKRLEELEQRVGIVPAALPHDPGAPLRRPAPRLADLAGIVLILAPLGVIGGLLTETYLDPLRPQSAPTVPLTSIVAFGHALLLGALTAAAITWMRHPLLICGLASVLSGYAVISLGLPIL